MASSYKGVVLPPSLTKTAGGQDMYVPFTGGSGPAPTVVNQVIAGAGVGLSPTGGTGVVTIANTGVTQLVAGAGVTLTPAGGTGAVTVSSPLAPAGAVGSVQFSGASNTLSSVNGILVAPSTGILSTLSQIVTGGIFSPYTGATFPTNNALAGTYSFQVTLPGNGGQLQLTEIMSLLAAAPHIIAVNVVSTTAPTGASCLGMVSCGGANNTPVVFGTATSNAAAYQLSVFGSANPTGGVLQVVGGTQATGGAATVFVTVLA